MDRSNVHILFLKTQNIHVHYKPSFNNSFLLHFTICNISYYILPVHYVQSNLTILTRDYFVSYMTYIIETIMVNHNLHTCYHLHSNIYIPSEYHVIILKTFYIHQNYLHITCIKLPHQMHILMYDL